MRLILFLLMGILSSFFSYKYLGSASTDVVKVYSRLKEIEKNYIENFFSRLKEAISK